MAQTTHFETARIATFWEGDDYTLSFRYTNHEGKTAYRSVLPDAIFYGTSHWHPELQWLMTGFDNDKEAQRTFAMKDMSDVKES